MLSHRRRAGPRESRSGRRGPCVGRSPCPLLFRSPFVARRERLSLESTSHDAMMDRELQKYQESRSRAGLQDRLELLLLVPRAPVLRAAERRSPSLSVFAAAHAFSYGTQREGARPCRRTSESASTSEAYRGTTTTKTTSMATRERWRTRMHCEADKRRHGTRDGAAREQGRGQRPSRRRRAVARSRAAPRAAPRKGVRRLHGPHTEDAAPRAVLKERADDRRAPHRAAPLATGPARVLAPSNDPPQPRDEADAVSPEG